jgi:multicomponent Na+:H+ antiporter subunit B
MIKKITLTAMLLFMLVVFSRNILWLEDNIDTTTKDYYTENSLYETGSKNIVTGIYLDYRLFDSIFETSLLLITVSGITFMYKKDDQSI